MLSELFHESRYVDVFQRISKSGECIYLLGSELGVLVLDNSCMSGPRTVVAT